MTKKKKVNAIKKIRVKSTMTAPDTAVWEVFSRHGKGKKCKICKKYKDTKKTQRGFLCKDCEEKGE
jgi:hypothetical protein